jgi:hypothetical protein
MLKGLAAAVIAVTFSAQLDLYLTNGRYTEGAIAMVQQIRSAFGF